MLKFTKMHGLGNDYVFIYLKDSVMTDFELLAKKVSNRNFGIGSDGLIVISKSQIADFKMEIYNLDGSRAKMCGNGIRCVGKFVWDNNLTCKKDLMIETDSGIKRIQLILDTKDKVKSVQVEMGKLEITNIVDITLDNCSYSTYIVDVGNLHGVIFVKEDVDEYVKKYGEYIYKLFGKKINVEFVQIIDNNKIKIAVYERGSGITLACGTGATASYFVAHKEKNLLNRGQVDMGNGKLEINILDHDSATMTGEAVRVFEGIYFN